MIDISHVFGSDLTASATGDLLVANAVDTGTQRVIRRLNTNPGDYIWNLEYGGGLPQMIGQPANASFIAGVIRGQLSKEEAVSPSPTPTVSVSSTDAGAVTANVKYVDSGTGTTQTVLVGP